jgi:hypothetical protein
MTCHPKVVKPKHHKPYASYKHPAATQILAWHLASELVLAWTSETGGHPKVTNPDQPPYASYENLGLVWILFWENIMAETNHVPRYPIFANSHFS